MAASLSHRFVVKIGSGSSSLGSGFLISPTTLVTCAHVILGRASSGDPAARQRWHEMLEQDGVDAGRAGVSWAKDRGVRFSTDGIRYTECDGNFYFDLHNDLALCRLVKPVRGIWPVPVLTGLSPALVMQLNGRPRFVGGFRGASSEPADCEEFHIRSTEAEGRLTFKADIVTGLSQGLSGGPVLVAVGRAWMCAGVVSLGGTGHATSVFVGSDRIAALWASAVRVDEPAADGAVGPAFVNAPAALTDEACGFRGHAPATQGEPPSIRDLVTVHLDGIEALAWRAHASSLLALLPGEALRRDAGSFRTSCAAGLAGAAWRVRSVQRLSPPRLEAGQAPAALCLLILASAHGLGAGRIGETAWENGGACAPLWFLTGGPPRFARGRVVGEGGPADFRGSAATDDGFTFRTVRMTFDDATIAPPLLRSPVIDAEHRLVGFVWEVCECSVLTLLLLDPSLTR